MDFVKWVKDIVYDCAIRVIDSNLAADDYEFTESELAEEIANLVELEINAHRQENKVPPIPMEILRKIDDQVLYGARVPITGTPLTNDIDRICSMPTPELDYLRWRLTEANKSGLDIPIKPVDSNVIKELRNSLGISHRELPLPWYTDPKPVKVWFNPPYTTVQFADGSKVTVEQTDFEDSKFSEYAGYCCAVTKKLFGTSTAAFKRFEEAKKKAIEDSTKFKKAKARRFEKERKAMNREEARRRREFEIHMEMERLKTEQEARKRLEAEK